MATGSEVKPGEVKPGSTAPSEEEMIDMLSYDYVITKKTGVRPGSDDKSNGQFYKLSTFSGDGPIKGEVSYREWRYEVLCLKASRDISDTSLITSVRRSLKGTAKQLLIPLGEKASIGEILKRLDLFFGDISTNEMIMQDFFNADHGQVRFRSLRV